METQCVTDPPSDDSIVMLIGAGASSYLGLPNLDDMLRQARPPANNGEVWKLILRVKDAIAAVPDRYSKAVFEELICKLKYYIDVCQMMRIDVTFKTVLNVGLNDVAIGSLERKWKQALTCCYRLLVAEYGPESIIADSTELGTTAKLIRRMAELNGNKLHIYTTNYDCAFQVLSTNCKDISFYSHIDNEIGTFTERWCPSVPELASTQLPMVFVHRLHGCVAWFTDERKPFCIEEVYGAGTQLSIDDDDYLHKMCIKLVTSQSLGVHPAFFLAFEEFANHLKRADLLVVWGHSFRDIEVLRHINASFTQRDTPLEILYIDPFVPEQQALMNIRRTLADAPVQVSGAFVPKKIPWISADGHDKLVETTMEYVKKGDSQQCQPSGSVPRSHSQPKSCQMRRPPRKKTRLAK